MNGVRRALVAATALVGLMGLSAWKSAPRLTTLVRGGPGPTTLVLLHGYRSCAAEWEPFMGTMAVGSPSRFLFPEGPEVVAGHPGEAEGHAWFKMNLEGFIPAGASYPDLSGANPEGLETAAASVRELLARASRETLGHLPVLGGFSQGAMVAGEVAFNSAQPIAALVLLSVTPVDEAAWRRGFGRRRGLPVFIAHGRADPSLSFAAAERLRREMDEAGLAVTWYPFNGGHEMPSDVIVVLNEFLAARGLIAPQARPVASSPAASVGDMSTR